MNYTSLDEASQCWDRLQPDRESYKGQAQRGLDDAIIALKILGSENGIGDIIEDIEILKRKVEGLR